MVRPRRRTARVRTTGRARGGGRAAPWFRWRLRTPLPRRVEPNPSQPVPDCDAPNVRRRPGNRSATAAARADRSLSHMRRWLRLRRTARCATYQRLDSCEDCEGTAGLTFDLVDLAASVVNQIVVALHQLLLLFGDLGALDLALTNRSER